MILRKPYAFLIKHFKLFHMFLAFFIGYLIYQSYNIYSFLNGYVSNVTILIGSELTDGLFNNLIFIVPFVIMISSIILLSVMFTKEKPYTQYVYNVLFYLVLVVLFAYSKDMVAEMELSILDIREVRALRDITLMSLIFQALSFIFALLRATGFDIKKFDFDKDLAQLDIEFKDNEEFEVNVELDSNVARRKFNYFFRHTKYIYLENKLIANIVIIIFLLSSAYTLFINSSIFNKNYSLNETFRTNNFTMTIEKAFLTYENYKLEQINENPLIVLEVNLDNNYTTEAALNLGQIALVVDGDKYYHNSSYRDSLVDLGIVYESQLISEDKYLLVYEVPVDKLNEDMVFVYYDDLNNLSIGLDTTKYIVDIDYFELDEMNSLETIELGENYDYSDVVYDDLSITIKSAVIRESFEISYQTTINDITYSFIDYVNSTLDKSYDEAVLRISYDFDIGSNNFIASFYSLIKNYGYIEYVIDNKKYTYNLTDRVTPSKLTSSYLYLEVPEDVLNATSINVLLNIRNEIISYTVK
ncbi:MAG: hypothetical protein R3Y21_02095 [Mycoplasmatota bacterium]